MNEAKTTLTISTDRAPNVTWCTSYFIRTIEKRNLNGERRRVRVWVRYDAQTPQHCRLCLPTELELYCAANRRSFRSDFVAFNRCAETSISIRSPHKATYFRSFRYFHPRSAPNRNAFSCRRLCDLLPFHASNSININIHVRRA